MCYKQKLLTALEHYQKLINGMYSIRKLLNEIESTYQQDTTTLPPRSLNRPSEKLPGSKTTTEAKVFSLMCEINEKRKENITYFIDNFLIYELLELDFEFQEFLEKKASNDDLNKVIKIVYESDESDDKELINARIQEYINEVS